MEKIKELSLLAIAGLIVTFVVAWIVAPWGFKALDFSHIAEANILELFVTLLIVALVIERAVEVYTAQQFGSREFSARAAIRAADAHLVRVRASIAAENGTIAGASADQEAAMLDLTAKNERRAMLADQEISALAWLRDTEKDAADALAELKTTKSKHAFVVSLLLSLLSAVAGVHLLGLLNAGTTVTLPPEQETWFQFADIAITTLLLAGGAEGIHQTARKFLNYRNELKSA